MLALWPQSLGQVVVVVSLGLGAPAQAVVQAWYFRGERDMRMTEEHKKWEKRGRSASFVERGRSRGRRRRKVRPWASAPTAAAAADVNTTLIYTHHVCLGK